MHPMYVLGRLVQLRLPGMLLSLRGATAELFKLINMETLISPDVLIPASICARLGPPFLLNFPPALPNRVSRSVVRLSRDGKLDLKCFLVCRNVFYFPGCILSLRFLFARYTKFLHDYFAMKSLDCGLRMSRDTSLLIFVYLYNYHFSYKYIINFFLLNLLFSASEELLRVQHLELLSYG